MPDAREQSHDDAGFDTMAFRRHLGLKGALALGDIYQLIGEQDAALIPVEVMIDRMMPRRVWTSRLYPFIAHGGGGTFPGILLWIRVPEINVVASHS